MDKSSLAPYPTSPPEVSMQQPPPYNSHGAMSPRPYDSGDAMPPSVITSVSTIHQLSPGHGCPVCHNNSWTGTYSCCAWFWAICCFPCGILCCLCMRKKKCSKCGFALN